MTSTYDESQHPRGDGGKFATKDGGRASAGQIQLDGTNDEMHPAAAKLKDYIVQMGESIDSAQKRLTPPSRMPDHYDFINRDLGMDESHWTMPDGSTLRVKDSPDASDHFLKDENHSERYTLDKETGKERYSLVTGGGELNGGTHTVVERQRDADGTLHYTHDMVSNGVHSIDAITESPDGSMVHTSIPDKRLNQRTTTAVSPDGGISVHRQEDDRHTITVASGETQTSITYTDPAPQER